MRLPVSNLPMRPLQEDNSHLVSVVTDVSCAFSLMIYTLIVAALPCYMQMMTPKGERVYPGWTHLPPICMTHGVHMLSMTALPPMRA